MHVYTGRCTVPLGALLVPVGSFLMRWYGTISPLSTGSYGFFRANYRSVLTLGATYGRSSNILASLYHAGIHV